MPVKRWLKAEAEPTVRGRNYQANRSLKAAHFTMCDGKNRANDTEKYATQKCMSLADAFSHCTTLELLRIISISVSAIVLLSNDKNPSEGAALVTKPLQK